MRALLRLVVGVCVSCACSCKDQARDYRFLPKPKQILKGSTPSTTTKPPEYPEMVLTIDDGKVRVQVHRADVESMDEVISLDETINIDVLRKATELTKKDTDAVRVVTSRCTPMKDLAVLMDAGMAIDHWSANVMLRFENEERLHHVQVTYPEVGYSQDWRHGVHAATHAVVFPDDGEIRFSWGEEPEALPPEGSGDGTSLATVDRECGRESWSYTTNLGEYLTKELCGNFVILSVPTWLSLGMAIRLRQELEERGKDLPVCGNEDPFAGMGMATWKRPSPTDSASPADAGRD